MIGAVPEELWLPDILEEALELDPEEAKLGLIDDRVCEETL